MLRRFAPIAALAAVIVVMSGCASPAATPDTGSAPAQTAPAPAAAITAMTLEERQQFIAPNFQVEVPVPSGEVVRGQAQGDLAWDYELIVAAPPTAVAAWYTETYTGREWQVAEQTAPTPGAITVTMTKGGAQTRVAITPEGDKSRVKAVLGIGAPVLQTQ